MRSVLAPVLAAVLLAAAGTASWTIGQATRRETNAREWLATMQFEAATAVGQTSEGWAGYEALAPAAGAGVLPGRQARPSQPAARASASVAERPNVIARAARAASEGGGAYRRRIASAMF